MNASAYTEKIREILFASDLDLVTSKVVRKQLEASSGLDLTPIKDDLNNIIKIIYNEVASSKHGGNTGTNGNGAVQSHSTSNGTVKLEPSSTPSSVIVKTEKKTVDPITSAPSTPAASNKRKSIMPTPSSRNPRKKVKSEEIITEDDDDEVGDGVEDDEAMARRLQNQENSRGSRRVATRGVASGRVASHKKSKSDGAVAKKRGGGGFNTAMILSPALAELMGETTMARPAVVKRLWQHIKDKDLQNPNNKKEILNDDALKAVFKVAKMGIFEMNKLLTPHLKKADDVAGGSAEVSDEEEDEEIGDEEEIEKPKRRASKPPKKAASSKGTTKRGGGGGLNAPMILSEGLSALLGGQKVLSRPAVVKQLWVYIKANKLQDPNDGRNILFDDAMKSVFKVSKSTSFQLSKHLSPHLMKPADVVGGEALVEAENDDADRNDVKYEEYSGDEEEEEKEAEEAPSDFSDPED
ncbi:hypothetical protein HDU67_003948 [Dinochytrium kinnereticum]|nr:hypothetical protein HDU67_003948 [Dinochytrium kinnereticum]